jgi:hypothetical protein
LSSVEIWASSSPPHPQVEDREQDKSIHDFLQEMKEEVRIIFFICRYIRLTNKGV